jgi:hypothetical protein
VIYQTRDVPSNNDYTALPSPVHSILGCFARQQSIMDALGIEPGFSRLPHHRRQHPGPMNHSLTIEGKQTFCAMNSRLTM